MVGVIRHEQPLGPGVVGYTSRTIHPRCRGGRTTAGEVALPQHRHRLLAVGHADHVTHHHTMVVLVRHKQPLAPGILGQPRRIIQPRRRGGWVVAGEIRLSQNVVRGSVHEVVVGVQIKHQHSVVQRVRHKQPMAFRVQH